MLISNGNIGIAQESHSVCQNLSCSPMLQLPNWFFQIRTLCTLILCYVFSLMGESTVLTILLIEDHMIPHSAVQSSLRSQIYSFLISRFGTGFIFCIQGQSLWYIRIYNIVPCHQVLFRFSRLVHPVIWPSLVSAYSCVMPKSQSSPQTNQETEFCM